MRKTILGWALLGAVLLLGACGRQDKSLCNDVLGEQIVALRHLAKAANAVDCDATSLAAYHRADSLLNMAAKASSFYVGETCVNAALTEIFYGMSYSRALYAMESTRGEDEGYLMQYLDEVVERPVEDVSDSLDMVAFQGVSCLFSVLNFYMLTTPEMCGEMIEDYAKTHFGVALALQTDTTNMAIKVSLLNNRGLYFQTVGPMVMECYSLLHDEDVEAQNSYLEELNTLADQLGACMVDVDQVSQLEEEVYWQTMSTATAICADLTERLAGLLEEIRSREMDYYSPMQQLYLSEDEAQELVESMEQKEE